MPSNRTKRSVACYNPMTGTSANRISIEFVCLVALSKTKINNFISTRDQKLVEHILKRIEEKS
ncbi:hypothetical protein BpHYR1_036602 [Brachionus plicatilis]|uniref:Uncharacterized protein n=1 Tax=Brachionus plicatilis TaxID=10195 RepID=A0A3M7T3A8_BRAPC|nr:hypothetical protein BpHYR1_036602 [Brachionus plicatilis]